jgi:hypothetical protein
MFNKSKKYAIIGEMPFEVYIKIIKTLEPSYHRWRSIDIEEGSYETRWLEQMDYHPELIKQYGGPILFPDKDGDYWWWDDKYNENTKNIKECEIIHVDEIKEKCPEYFV